MTSSSCLTYLELSHLIHDLLAKQKLFTPLFGSRQWTNTITSESSCKKLGEMFWKTYEEKLHRNFKWIRSFKFQQYPRGQNTSHISMEYQHQEVNMWWSGRGNESQFKVSSDCILQEDHPKSHWKKVKILVRAFLYYKTKYNRVTLVALPFQLVAVPMLKPSFLAIPLH